LKYLHGYLLGGVCMRNNSGRAAHRGVAVFGRTGDLRLAPTSAQIRPGIVVPASMSCQEQRCARSTTIRPPRPESVREARDAPTNHATTGSWSRTSAPDFTDCHCLGSSF